MDRYIDAAIAALQPALDPARPQPAPDGQPFTLLESRLFAPQERIRIQIHHPRWAIAPLKQPHTHDFFELTYVCRGEFVQVIDGHQFTQTPDQLVLLRPGTYHSTWIERETDVVFNILLRKQAIADFLLHFLSAQNTLHEFFFQAIHSPESAASHVLLSTTVKQAAILERIVAEYFDRQPGYQDAILGQFLLFLAEVTRTLEQQPMRAETRAEEILEYIAANYRTVTQQAVAERFSYSTRQLSRLLDATTGQSFPTLVNNHKIDNICRQLAHSGVPLSRLVRESGYNDPDYFYRAFKRIRGISFADYRRGLPKD